MFTKFAFLCLIFSVLTSPLQASKTSKCPGDFHSKECKRKIAYASKLLNHACTISPFASGCTIHRVCEAAASTSDGCKAINSLLSICKEFRHLAPCRALTRSCGSVHGVLHCPGIVDLAVPTTKVAYEAMQKICGSHYMTGCDHCKTSKEFSEAIKDHSYLKDACYDPFGVLSRMCIEMDMIPCDPWVAWCAKPSTKDIPELCDIPTKSVNSVLGLGGCEDGPMTHSRSVQEVRDNMNMSVSTVSTHSDPCVRNPKKKGCESYVYPEESVLTDINTLCGTGRGGMPWMPSCNIWQDCTKRQDHSSYCTPFRVLATICEDMPYMGGCRNYDSLCQSGSQVQECTTQPPIPYAPTTKTTQEAIVKSCSVHTMPQCTQCPRQGKDCPNPMKTMSEMCYSMPSMQFCQLHTSFCSGTHNYFKSFCHLNSGDFLPPMRMYFHTGQRDIILFKDWIPESTTGYALSFLAIVVMGIIVQGMKFVRNMLENNWHRKILAAQEAAQSPTPATYGYILSLGIFSQTSFESIMFRNVIRAVLTGFVVTLDFALMLVAMTFNVGLFIAVVAGLVLGMLLFGHMPERDYIYKKKPLADQSDRQPYGGSIDGCCT
eukprot:g8095.t1